MRSDAHFRTLLSNERYIWHENLRELKASLIPAPKPSHAPDKIQLFHNMEEFLKEADNVLTQSLNELSKESAQSAAQDSEKKSEEADNISIDHITKQSRKDGNAEAPDVLAVYIKEEKEAANENNSMHYAETEACSDDLDDRLIDFDLITMEQIIHMTDQISRVLPKTDLFSASNKKIGENKARENVIKVSASTFQTLPVTRPVKRRRESIHTLRTDLRSSNIDHSDTGTARNSSAAPAKRRKISNALKTDRRSSIAVNPTASSAEISPALPSTRRKGIFSSPRKNLISSIDVARSAESSPTISLKRRSSKVLNPTVALTNCSPVKRNREIICSPLLIEVGSTFVSSNAALGVASPAMSGKVPIRKVRLIKKTSTRASIERPRRFST